MRRRSIYILFSLLALSGLLWAGDDGGTESVFSLGAGARAMGMGNGFTAIADDASAVYYNPAGIHMLKSQQVSFLHTILFEGTIYDFVSYVYPTHDWGGLGFAAMRLGTDDIGRRDNLTSDPADEDLAKFSASNMQFLISYARAVGERFSAGVSLKLANQSIDDMSAYGYGIDLGGLYQINDKLRAGVLLQDLVGPRLKLDAVRERIPFTIRGGLAYDIELSNHPISGTVSFDLEKPEKRSLKIRTGAEVKHRSGLILRTGYDRDNFSLGMGLVYENLRFDYAYKFIDELTDSHRFSVTFGFGRTREEYNARKEMDLRYRTLQLANEQRREALTKELEQADAYYEANRLDSALAAYYRADAFAEDKEYIQARISDILARIEESRGTKTVYRTDSILVAGTFNFEDQARDLYNRGALTAARDMVRLARHYGTTGDSLDDLEISINQAIDRTVRDHLERGRRALAEGEYINAYDAFNTVLSYLPDNQAARQGSRDAERGLTVAQHLNLALDYFNNNRYIDARSQFNIVIDLDKNNKTAREYLDKIEQRLKASTSLEDLQKDEQIWLTYLNGLEAFRQGDYQAAIEYWQAVLKVYPNNRNTQENIEQARLRLENKQ